MWLYVEISTNISSSLDSTAKYILMYIYIKIYSTITNLLRYVVYHNNALTSYTTFRFGREM